MKLTRDFYLRSGLELARDLIGKQLVHHSAGGTAKGIIVETEAYMGSGDAAAHSYKGLYTPRTAIQYGLGGHVYVYTIYGLHICMNIVANGENIPEVVLIRALEPTAGIDLMKKRRQKRRIGDLCSGPGKLTQAMDIKKEHYGLDLCGEEMYIETAGNSVPAVSATKRINVDYAGEAAAYPWRFVLRGSPYVSVAPRE